MAGSSSLQPPPPSLIELPRDVTTNILRRLGPSEILESTQFVCSTWRSLCLEPSMWHIIDIDDEHRFGAWTPRNYDSDSLCRLAVDLSHGELIEIRIKNFGWDDLLAYISDRSSRLKRLTLGHCIGISGEGLNSAVKKLPELEELHLFYNTQITSLDIPAIAISCPGLKSFTFDSGSYFGMPSDDSDAAAIAKNMPNLRQLELFGNRLTDEGLKAILDGCPRLESIDLRHCFNIEFQGDLQEQCVDRIKYLKLPYDC